MNTKTAFWSIFATFWIVGLLAWFFQATIMSLTFKSVIDAGIEIQSTFITGQFNAVLLRSVVLLLIPFYFLLANIWVKFRSIKQAWLFALSAFIFGCIGYYLRIQLIISTVNSAPTFAGLKKSITTDQLKFEQYFFFGSLLGCLVAGFWIWNANQKVTSKESGKL